MRNTKMLIMVYLFVWAIAFAGVGGYVVHIVTQQGVVTGIVYSLDPAMGRSSAIIDEQIVYEGDVIYGVKVARIERFTVEFDNNGIRWKQRVRQKPNLAWKKP